jgi:hypothetical protein
MKFEILTALETLDRTVGLFSLKVSGYVILASDPQQGGLCNVYALTDTSHALLANASLEQIAEWLAEVSVDRARGDVK